MKVKVDGITFKEFTEYVNSGFARQINMTLYIFLAITSMGIVFGLLTKMEEAVLKPLFVCGAVLLVLILSSRGGVGFMFKRSGLKETKCRYSFDEYGMDISIGKLTGDLEWEYVKHITETDNLWIIRVPGSQFILPKRCLENDKFREIVKNKLPEDKIKNKEENRGKDRRKRKSTPEGNNGSGEEDKR